jgi:hypothetical protein
VTTCHLQLTGKIRVFSEISFIYLLTP